MNRDEILAAAAQIFSQKGYHASSMQDIAEAVSLQKASLYHHVSSKQQILVELLDRALELLIERMEGDMALPLPPDEKLEQAMVSYIEALAEHRELASILLLEHRSLEPELKKHHVPRRDRFEALWRGLIQEGIQAGIYHCEHPAIATRAILGAMNWTIMWYSPDGPLSAGEIARQYARLYLKGLESHDGV